MERLATFLAMAIAMPTLPAAAQEYATRFHASHGPANCQAALPGFEPSVRKRPLGIVNESDTTVFVTCDTESNNVRDDSDGFSFVLVAYSVNTTQADMTVSCTLVDGYQIEATTYHPKSATVHPGFAADVAWTDNDNGGKNFYAPAISCSLPAHAQIYKVIFMYRELVTPDPF